VAVLGTSAGLEADDALDLDVGAAPLHPDRVREFEQRRDILIGKLEHLDELVAIEAAAFFEHLLASDLKDVRHEEDSILSS
jgi:hypothetical protein